MILTLSEKIIWKMGMPSIMLLLLWAMFRAWLAQFCFRIEGVLDQHPLDNRSADEMSPGFWYMEALFWANHPIFQNREEGDPFEKLNVLS